MMNDNKDNVETHISISGALGIIAWALITLVLTVTYYSVIFALLWNKFVTVQCDWLQRADASQSIVVGLAVYTVVMTLSSIARYFKPTVNVNSAPVEKERVLWKPTGV